MSASSRIAWILWRCFNEARVEHVDHVVDDCTISSALTYPLFSSVVGKNMQRRGIMAGQTPLFYRGVLVPWQFNRRAIGRSPPFFSSQSESFLGIDASVIEKGPSGTDVIAFSGLETERSNGQPINDSQKKFYVFRLWLTIDESFDFVHFHRAMVKSGEFRWRPGPVVRSLSR